MEINELLHHEPNLEPAERMQSATTGLLLLTSGLSNIKEKPTFSILKTLVGGYLLYRGATGYCPVSEILKEHFPQKENV